MIYLITFERDEDRDYLQTNLWQVAVKAMHDHAVDGWTVTLDVARVQ